MDSSPPRMVVELHPLVLHRSNIQELVFHNRKTDDLYAFKNPRTQTSLHLHGTFRQIHCTIDDLKIVGKLNNKLSSGHKIIYEKKLN